MTLRTLRFSASALATTFALLGCNGTVTSGTNTSSGADQGTSTGFGSSCDGFMQPTPEPAIAVTAAQLGFVCNGPESSGGTGGASGTGGAGGGLGTSGVGTTGGGGCAGVDPTTVYLELGTQAPTCGAPQPATPCGSWSVSIGIPAARLVVGEIALSDPSLISTFGELGSGNGGQCAGGGGSYVTGTLTITAVDASSVSFTLSGTQTFDFVDAVADGSYVAQRCP